MKYNARGVAANGPALLLTHHGPFQVCKRHRVLAASLSAPTSLRSLLDAHRAVWKDETPTGHLGDTASVWHRIWVTKKGQ
jgi:hypothetical protein